MAKAPKKKATVKKRGGDNGKESSPSSINKLIDSLVFVDDRIKRANAVVTSLNQEYEKIERALLESLQIAKLESAKTTKASVSIQKPVVIGLEDFDAIMAYVVKNNATDLVQRRVATQAVRDREADGEQIPGLKKTTLTKLGLTRTKVKK